MKIERTSTRLVKPCTSMDGPPLLVPLSNADLVFGPVHVNTLFAYPAPAPPTTTLEEGLQKVLCEYREWAGRITDDATSGRLAIELNDAGALLIEAEAHGSLQDLWPFTPSPILLDLNPISRGAPELFLIQVTRFACGGVTLGIAMQHQVTDGVGAIEFLHAWAAVVQGLPIACFPLHTRSALMGRDHPQPVFDHMEYQRPTAITPRHRDFSVKRLHFSTELLKKIKAKVAAGASADGVVYSTFISLLVHLWKCITIARGIEDEDVETGVLVSVDIRERLNPPLPKEYFGNAMCHTFPQVKIKDLVNKSLSFAASCVHEAIGKVNNDYARSALDFIELEQKKSPVRLVPREKTALTVTSWTRLPLYNLNFGWGTPIFAGNGFIPEGLVIFAPSHKQDGSIDVCLSLFAPHMEKLEAICFS